MNWKSFVICAVVGATAATASIQPDDGTLTLTKLSLQTEAETYIVDNVEQIAKIGEILDQFVTEKVFAPPPTGGSIKVDFVEDGVTKTYAFKNAYIAKDMQNPNTAIWYVLPEECYLYLNGFFDNSKP